MKYYCKYCGSEFISGRGFNTRIERPCFNPACDPSGKMIVVPDYETPEQYEQRTGEPWPDKGAIYYKFTDHPELGWNVKELAFAKFLYQAEIRKKEIIMVCGNGNKPPPDGWEPEGGGE